MRLPALADCTWQGEDSDTRKVAALVEDTAKGGFSSEESVGVSIVIKTNKELTDLDERIG